mmetsp:Transcript_8826/g.13148  ORF Transcript_8826/g.13148 Transcript_8826/m.13148 type:complete len:212 (+) Transcript_8826:24-659(+)
MDYSMDRLWKDFGRETSAGRALYSLYGARSKPQVYYPPVKTKKKPLPCEGTKSKAKPKPEIDYPQPKMPRPRFHPIDFVPKRKNQDSIKQEVSSNYKELNPPPKRGTNREELKSNLQEKFQFSTGALPESVMMPVSKRVQPKPAPKKQQKEEIPEDLSALFDMVVKEIQERQKFLQDLQEMGQLDKEREGRIKAEIAERVSELQKIKEMMS